MPKVPSPFGDMESPDKPATKDPFGIPIEQPESDENPNKPVTRKEFDKLVERVEKLEEGVEPPTWP